jgi:hypothetical protein
MANPVLVNGATGVLATAIQIRQSGCNVFGYHIYNASNATAYVQFFDSSPAVPPTVGTTVPKWSIGVPTVAHAFMALDATGLDFTQGLWVAATTTAGGSGAPNVAVNVNLAIG